MQRNEEKYKQTQLKLQNVLAIIFSQCHQVDQNLACRFLLSNFLSVSIGCIFMFVTSNYDSQKSWSNVHVILYIYVQPREFEPQFRTPRRLFTFELMAHGSHSDMNVSSSTSALFITSRVLWGHQVHSLFRFCRNLWRFSCKFALMCLSLTSMNSSSEWTRSATGI